MRLKPLQDWAVIAPLEQQRTAGGLYIPDTAKEKPQEGVVEAIGPGAYEEEKRGKKKEEKKERKFIPTVVKPGDRVLFEKWSGQTYTIDHEEKILVRERNILGLLERPIEIPAATSSGSSTAMIEHPLPPLMTTQGKGTPVSKAAPKKTAKKAKPTAKPKKKAAKKATKKALKKKTAKKKTSKKK